jgi:hypothetical protein
LWPKACARRENVGHYLLWFLLSVDATPNQLLHLTTAALARKGVGNRLTLGCQSVPDLSVGGISGDAKDKLTLLTDPEDSTRVVKLKKSEVDDGKPSPASLMPVGLLTLLNENEVLDLIAHLLSRGDPGHPMVRK